MIKRLGAGPYRTGSKLAKKRTSRNKKSALFTGNKTHTTRPHYSSKKTDEESSFDKLFSALSIKKPVAHKKTKYHKAIEENSFDKLFSALSIKKPVAHKNTKSQKMHLDASRASSRTRKAPVRFIPQISKKSAPKRKSAVKTGKTEQDYIKRGYSPKTARLLSRETSPRARSVIHRNYKTTGLKPMSN